MAYSNEDQRRRWTRNNADLYIGQDAERFFLPGRCPEELKPRHRRNSVDRSVRQPAEDFEPALSPQEVEAIESERLAIRREMASLRLELALLRFKYNSNQPRVPAGNPDGGQWTDGDASAGQLIEISAARKAKGHHFVPQSLYRDLPLRPETRDVFDRATTGPLRAGRHGWSQAHDFYNQAINDHLDRFLERNNMRPEQLTPDQARSFIQELKQSTDSRVRDFNLRIFRQEFQYWLRRGPRGRE